MQYNWPSLFPVGASRKKAISGHPFLTTNTNFQLQRNQKGIEEPSLSAALEWSVVFHVFSDKDRFVEFALQSVLEILNAHAGSLFLWEEKTKELVLKKAAGPYLKNVSDVRMRLREGVSGKVAEEGMPLLVKDAYQDERLRGNQHSRHYHTSSFISLPLLAGNRLLGVVNVTEKENLQPFDEEDLARAEAIARHIAVAYENLKTKKYLRKENEELAQEVMSLRERLKQQEPLVSVGRLASNLAHELNNPLDAIRRFVNLALDQVLEDSLAREYLLKAKKGIRQSIQVIRGLLCFSREARPQAPRKIELHEVIEKSLTLASQNRSFEKIHFKREFCGENVWVEDRGLPAVFQNLFDNSHHAMKGAGTITVCTRPNGRYVMISVRDTGCGVAPEFQEHIFQPFFTTKDHGEGTGIGLAICREIVVERSGGEIFFESTPNNGTTFFIKIPYEKAQNGK